MTAARACLGLIGFLMLAAGSWAQVTNFWRFEDSAGFTGDSVGSATLANSGTNQLTLPGTGRGSAFLTIPSAKAAEFSEGDRLSGSIAARTGDFTIEAFIHRDTNSGVYYDLIAGSTDTNFNNASTYAWTFNIRLDGAGGTSPNELILYVSNGTTEQTMESNFIIPTSKDYYVAAAFNLSGGTTTFYVQNLTDGGGLQSFTASHTLTSIASRTGIFIGGHASHATGDIHFAGLIDDVRLANGALTQSSLLVSAIPEPGTYALMVGGAGLLLAGLRRVRSGRPSPA